MSNRSEKDQLLIDLKAAIDCVAEVRRITHERHASSGLWTDDRYLWDGLMERLSKFRDSLSREISEGGKEG